MSFRRENQRLANNRNGIELLERPQQQLDENRLHLNDLYRDRKIFLIHKTIKIKKAISNAGVSYLFENI